MKLREFLDTHHGQSFLASQKQFKTHIQELEARVRQLESALRTIKGIAESNAKGE